MTFTASAIEEQTSGVELNPNSESKILWVFGTPEVDNDLSGGPGSIAPGYPWGHCGDDYYANDLGRQEMIFAGISGIAHVEDNSVWGKEIIIYDSTSKFALRYAHLSWYDKSIDNKWVSATSKTPIGKVGELTGQFGTGPHLHLVLYKNVDSLDRNKNPIVSSCAVVNGRCQKTATKYAAKFSFVPRTGEVTETDTKDASLQKDQPKPTLTLYVREGSASGPFIPNAHVTGKDGSDNNFDQTTDSNGYVKITGTPGTWSFTASASGYVDNPWEQEITETDTKDASLQKVPEETVTTTTSKPIPPPVTLTLYVHEGNQNGPIIPGAQVTANDNSGNSFQGTTNAEGFVTIAGTPGTWSFTASASGYVDNPWEQEITETDTKDASLQKVQQETVPETQLPADQSKPITLILYVNGGSASGPTIPGAAVTGQDGSGSSFEQTTDNRGSAMIAGNPGTWSFSASADGYETKSWSQPIATSCAKHAFLQEAKTQQKSVVPTTQNSESCPESCNGYSNNCLAVLSDPNKALECYESAAKCFENAVQQNPNNAECWYHLGNALHNSGSQLQCVSGRYDNANEMSQFDDAIKALDRAIELDPLRGGFWNEKGVILEQQGKFDEAKKCFDKAIETNPQNSLVSLWRENRDRAATESSFGQQQTSTSGVRHSFSW